MQTLMTLSARKILKNIYRLLSNSAICHMHILSTEKMVPADRRLHLHLQKHFNVKTVLLMATRAVYVNHANRQSLTIILILYISPMTNPA